MCKHQLTRLRTVVGVMAVFCSVVSSYCFGEDMDMRIKLHFQKLTFNIPEDKFFIAYFDKDKGTMDWSGEYETPSPIKIGNESYNGFIEPQPNKNYALMLRRVGNQNLKYKFYLINLKNNKIIKDFGNQSGGQYQEEFYFLSGWNLIKLNYDSKQESKISDKITAIATTNEKLWEFSADRKIKELSMGNEKIIGDFDGIVTDAGYLDGDFIWYFQRKNEKSTGNLWVLNVRTGKKNKIDKDLPQCRLVSREVI